MNLKLIQKMIATLSLVLIPALYNSCGEPYHSTDAASGDFSSISNSPESISIFSTTLQPVLIQNCGQCHGASQSPQFAVSSAVAGHATILNFGLVNFSSPNSSKLVQKILNGHQGFSSTLANTIETKITEWGAAITVAGAPPPAIVALTPTFSSIKERIFASKCLDCHGSQVAKDGIRYDTHSRTLQTVNLLKPAESKLYTTVRSGSMPENPYTDLTNEEVAIVLEWINLGAPNN